MDKANFSPIAKVDFPINCQLLYRELRMILLEYFFTGKELGEPVTSQIKNQGVKFSRACFERFTKIFTMLFLGIIKHGKK